MMRFLAYLHGMQQMDTEKLDYVLKKKQDEVYCQIKHKTYIQHTYIQQQKKHYEQPPKYYAKYNKIFTTKLNIRS